MQPKNNELLSSWLCRNAQLNGLNPYRFCKRILPSWPVWDRDIDRSVSEELLAELSTWTGLDTAELIGMTLMSVSHDTLNQVECTKAVSPFLLSSGIFGRFRKLYGVQYCPLCLEANRYLTKDSRYAFVTNCSKHDVFLSNRCPRCGSPVLPHKSVSIDKCAVCNCSLVHESIHGLKKSPILPISLEIKELVESGICGSIFGGTVPSKYLLNTLRQLLCVVYEVNSKLVVKKDERKNQFEFMDADDRYFLLNELGEACHDWPNGFYSYMSKYGVTQRKFKRFTWPRKIEDEIAALPSGRKRNVQYAPLIYNQSMRKIRKDNKNKYRLERSDILMRDCVCG